jgi:hypothetical protein
MLVFPPPKSSGGAHSRLTDSDVTEVAVRPVGKLGVLTNVVGVTAALALPAPARFTVVTVMLYLVPAFRPVMSNSSGSQGRWTFSIREPVLKRRTEMMYLFSEARANSALWNASYEGTLHLIKIEFVVKFAIDTWLSMGRSGMVVFLTKNLELQPASFWAWHQKLNSVYRCNPLSVTNNVELPLDSKYGVTVPQWVALAPHRKLVITAFVDLLETKRLP